MINGTRISLSICVGLVLLPLSHDVYAITAVEQIQQRLSAAIIQDLDQWQKQQDIKQLRHKLELRIPSSAKSLPVCSQKLKVSPGKGLAYGRVQRKLSCSSENWSLYVRAMVSVTALLPVVNRNMQRDETVKKSDIQWRTLTLKTSDKDILTKESEIIDQQVARKLRKNIPIRVSYLDSPVLVKLGEPVIIEAALPGFNAEMTGVAMDTGKLDQAIRVKNTSSGKVITAYPIAKGRVQTRF
ncbi:flagellar basal body P-ring formation chaperone FlgA [Shewanella frigidimarina]|uniref:Flagella basal body P-ring formation protein FlgA n=1 Tax=Shewanella frigidimarina TaxID=56812 RepID=A0A106BWA0_SHEFR|nr:flagellar basal body P-ring formation chaperone FlgA [Shewanella frigidimarina]KVW99802.1 flagellar biosynthesis protein FlgA [Shewanella frigidimarina]